MTIETPPYSADIKPLTTLRFFAALVVVIHHFGYFAPYPVEEYTSFLKKGYLAVDFFFILSGFILTHAYTASYLTGRFSRHDFLLRRFARIYPVHIVMLTLMAVVAMTPLHFGPIKDWPGEYPWDLLFHNIILIQGWGIDDTLGFNIPSWSISAEWFAYLLFPFLLPLCVRLSPAFLLICSGAAYVGLWLVSNHIDPLRPLTEFTNDFSIFRIMPAFVLGMALYRFKAVRASNNMAGWGIIVYAGIAALCMHKGFIDILTIPCFALIIVWAADLDRLGRSSWLARPWPVWLGEISYALYMVHYPVMVLVMYNAQLHMPAEAYQRIFPLLACGSLALMLPAAALLYHGVEVPARRWITGRRRIA